MEINEDFENKNEIKNASLKKSRLPNVIILPPLPFLLFNAFNTDSGNSLLPIILCNTSLENLQHQIGNPQKILPFSLFPDLPHLEIKSLLTQGSKHLPYFSQGIRSMLISPLMKSTSISRTQTPCLFSSSCIPRIFPKECSWENGAINNSIKFSLGIQPKRHN